LSTVMQINTTELLNEEFEYQDTQAGEDSKG
jgi:hypothetical protein